MEELDQLLEELAQAGAAASSVEEKRDSTLTDDGELPGAGYSGLSKDRGSVHSNIYSELPPPVTATVEPDSPTKELDSILQDLMSLGDQAPAYPSTPPPLTKKLSVKVSVKRQKEGEKQERKEGKEGSCSGSDSKASNAGTDSIDELLGGLTSDLQKIGIRTTAKGHCASCKKCIVGKMITALGEVWHPEHFVCTHCKTELGTTGFFEREGQPYCNRDYQDLFSPRCAYCKGPIVQQILTALDQTWHPEHFFCMHCGELFGPEGFMEKEGKPYCTKDFYQLFAPKCTGCGESVRENYLTAANGTWHPECFVCADCLKPFSGGSFMELDGRPLCPLHFHSRQGTLCDSCNQPIMGRCISALDRKFHPEHFVCVFCQRQLSQGIFKEQRGEPYCSACYNKVFVTI